MLGMNDRRTPASRRCMVTSQEGWDAKRVHEPKGRYRTRLSKTGNLCVLEGIAIRQRQLSPDQYEIVDVRTSRGVLRSALLIGGRPRRLSARRCGSSVSVSN
jgi:hypothetical protein